MIKTKLGTRLLSVLMALTMLLGLVPLTALAADENHQQTYDFMMYYGETAYPSGISATANSGAELPEVSSVDATVDSMAYDNTDSDWATVKTLLQEKYTGAI